MAALGLVGESATADEPTGGTLRPGGESQRALLQELWDSLRAQVESSSPTRAELSWTTEEGERRHVAAETRRFSGGPRESSGWVTAVVDVTRRKQTDDKLRESEEFYRILFEHAGFGIALVDPVDGRRVAFNRNLHERLGYTRAEYEHLTVADIQYQDSRELALRRARMALAQGTCTFEEQHRTKGGEKRDVLVSAVPVTIGGKELIHAISLDITEQRQLEGRLRQAQRMEAVGRLAGGVAHDFNNMLNVILGYADLSLNDLSDTERLHENLLAIQKAAERSADLTRQLLSFSRNQIVEPRVLVLNEFIAEELEILKCMMGEEIQVQYRPAADLSPVRIDPTQVHQILTNLAANARDAINDVGTVTIETRNVTVDRNYSDPELRPGAYVMLAFGDSGTGMDAQTIDHIFEPFYTTKERGKGTGLGLATIYGIAKQNGGGVYAYSEPGRGTTIKIYLPIWRGEAAAPRGQVEICEPCFGTETVLIVEDESSLLKLTDTILKSHGYQTICASDPDEAVRLSADFDGEIHLLLTDVVMPSMNGKELRERVQAQNPGVRTLFMSGYTSDVISGRGVLEEGLNFIHKPFSVKDLTSKVRQVLDQ